MCVHRRLAAVLLPLLFAITLPAQVRLTLEQAGARMAPDWTPVYEGKEVIVTGQVSSRPLWDSESYYLPIQDKESYGLMLESTEGQFHEFVPGDWVEVQGAIVRHTGLPVLLPHAIRRLYHAAPPAPKALKPSELASFRYLGVLVRTETSVLRERESAVGELIAIGEKGKTIDVFLPRMRHDSESRLSALRTGDRIRVVGIASQLCPLPPYDRFFQVLIPDAAATLVLEKAWMIPPPMLLAALILAGALLAVWWFRERRMAGLRKQMRLLNALGEEVIGASSPADILRRLELTLPKLAGVTGIGMYLLNRGTKKLESVHATGPSAGFIELESPVGAMATGIAACFRNRTLIAIADTRRSPFFRKEEGATPPRAVMFVPMFAQSELVGVLELHHSERLHYFSAGEQAALQHLANQVATALRLQEQQSVREQLFRSEKLAAAGQLISDVANELRTPLDSIVSLASALRTNRVEESREQLQAIADEARRASQIVARLVSFAKVEQSEAEPVDLNGMLAGLLKFREPECKAKGVEIRPQLASLRTTVMGSPGQLEQVLLNLLVDAEKAAADAVEKVITVSSSLLAKRMLVEITYGTRSLEFQSDGNPGGPLALALGACRSIIQSHGGDFRVIRVSPTQARFDVELPVVETRAAESPLGEFQPRSRQLTVLAVDPDAKMQRQLLHLLAKRGDRVVPVSNAEEGLDLVQRTRFDLALCAVRLPGLNWVEFFERVRHQVGGFVLLTDGFDTDLARAFQGSEGFVLSKPVEEAELLRICRVMEERAAVGARS